MKLHHALLLVILPLALRADETWSGTSDVKFRGYSTLHNFEGTVTQVPLKVTVTGEKDERVVSATSDVPVQQMNTAKPDRDRNMWTMFQEAKFRFIKVEVNRAAERDLRPPGAKPGAMTVTLSIAGTRGTVSAAVTNVSESANQGSFDLAFPISLKAFKLEPPSAIGGLVKVKDTVDVTVHVTLKKDGAP
jgi:hypothetical protein